MNKIYLEFQQSYLPDTYFKKDLDHIKWKL